ncbi:thioredoxin family protein [Streptomyces cellulosae]|uniref:Thioredoxin family protein n=1 Tax=Streptomyces cellulosae TaxID=1968 RepID=A0ABW6JS34_STRCE
MSSKLIEVTDESFEADVLRAELPVLVAFVEPGASSSESLVKVMEKIAEEYGGRVVVAKVDFEANPKATYAAKLQSVPEVHSFVNGGHGISLEGVPSKDEILQLVGLGG